MDYRKLRNLGYMTISNKFTKSLQNIITLTMRQSSCMVENSNSKAESVYAVNYLWTASVEDMNTHKHELFYGRTWEDFNDFIDELITCAKLEKLASFDDENIRYAMTSSQKKRTDIRIYDHDLSNDFQFLRNCFGDDLFGRDGHVFARDVRKPMYAWVSKNKSAIRFIDSSKLRPGTLKDWADDERLEVRKESDYKQTSIKHPLSKLTAYDMNDCYTDNQIIAHGIKKYRDKYYILENIPLTQAGEVRRECKEVIPRSWITNCQNVLRSYDFETYQELCRIFIGGSIHSNFVYRYKNLDNVKSFDIGSDYPGILSTRRFPVSAWEDTTDYDDPDYFYYYKIHFKNVNAKLMNTFWPVSKLVSSDGLVHDDFNVRSAKSMTVYITDVDLNIFRKVYSFTDMEILKARRSKAAYLPKNLVKLILKHYNQKTKLKGTSSISEYTHSKVSINCFYGVFVTRDITDDVYFDENGWQVDELTEEKFLQKRNEQAEKDIFTIYQIGPWVTAYAREMLWSAIIPLDRKVVYFDTDCVKGLFNENDVKVFHIINKTTLSVIHTAAEHYGIDVDMYSPLGKTIGFYEQEHTAIEFKTIGSKRYAALYEDGLDTVISGLSKEAGLKKIHTVDDLNDDMEWTEDESGRLTFYYLDSQKEFTWKDDDGITYKNNELYAVAKIPATFEFGNKSDVKVMGSAISGGRPTAYFDRTKIFRD